MKKEDKKLEQIESLVKEIPKTKKKRKAIWFILIMLIMCCVILVGVTIFAWYGGHLQKELCDIVEPNSDIWAELECIVDHEIIETGEGEYKYNVIQEDARIVVNSLEQVVIDVVDQSASAVVGIGISDGDINSDQIIGSGFIIAANGLIVTNQHVVSLPADANYYVSIPNIKEKIIVSKIYRDVVNDIAVLEIDKSDLTTLPLGDSVGLDIGQTVIAIGNPLGDLSSTVTVGVISGTNRDIEVSGVAGSQSKVFSDVILTDAAINPGNSGGPLLNSNGEVVGISFASIAESDSLSFAVPIDRVKVRLEELNKYGEFRIPFLGIEYRRRVIYFEGKSQVGAIVNNIALGSPADEVGLAQGDIIISYDGKTFEQNTLLNLIQNTNIGDNIEITYIRDDVYVTVVVTVGTK